MKLTLLRTKKEQRSTEIKMTGFTEFAAVQFAELTKKKIQVPIKLFHL